MTLQLPVSAEAAQSPLCFVIGPIGKDGSVERNHSDLLLNLLVKHVLETDEFGYHVKRADDDADPGMIADRMVTDIIRADLVVADLTDSNPNAFYELGIRHSTEKPTIHVAKAGTLLPFDNAAHRAIFVDLTKWPSIWKHAGDLPTRRATSRLQTIGSAIQSPKPTPVSKCGRAPTRVIASLPICRNVSPPRPPSGQRLRTDFRRPDRQAVLRRKFCKKSFSRYSSLPD